MPATTSFITVYEAARHLRVTVDYIYRLIYSGRLRAAKVNRRWEINEESLAAYRRSRGGRDGR